LPTFWAFISLSIYAQKINNYLQENVCRKVTFTEWVIITLTPWLLLSGTIFFNSSLREVYLFSLNSQGNIYTLSHLHLGSI
jgi:hypothetical protein